MPTKFLKTLKEKINNLARAIGTAQSALLLTLFYYLILGPIALIYRGARSFSKPKSLNPDTYWIKRPTSKPTKENLQKQF
jgi:hypothetical protein